MLNAYTLTPKGPLAHAGFKPDGTEQHVGWVDLLSPTPEEDKAAEAFLGVSIPTREEAHEIEFSSRFYQEDGAMYLTVSVVAGIDAGDPKLTPLSFILSRSRLATVRYEHFSAFKQFFGRLHRIGESCTDSAGVMLTLTDAIIDRLADVVEKVGGEIDRLNREIFGRSGIASSKGVKRRERRLEAYLQQLGSQNDIVSLVRESLASIERMLQYVNANGLGPTLGKSESGQIKLMTRDVRSLTDHLSFLSNRATFLLEATLGLISVQQNDVIRVFTAVATILLPPTLIGTVYGMNFEIMPETDWSFGYPFAIGLMVASALIPYFILKRRGWF